MTARRRQLRYWPPFSLPDIGSPLQRFLLSHSNTRSEHRINVRAISAAGASNIYQWKWRPIPKLSPPSGQLRELKCVHRSGVRKWDAVILEKGNWVPAFPTAVPMCDCRAVPMGDCRAVPIGDCQKQLHISWVCDGLPRSYDGVLLASRYCGAK
jgi:hypothetical protein